jgi:uncharacterized membrane protein
MPNASLSTGSIKYVIGWVAVFLIRLIPYRPPNFEPMLAVAMPFSKRYGLVGSFAFGFLGIALFDAVTSGLGMWTWITAGAYGLLGVGAHYYFKHREANTLNFLVYGIIGTIAYDAVTGLSIGPLFFGQTFMSALTGQIPFTLMHLLGTVLFSVTVSPALYRWVITNDRLELTLPTRRPATSL